MTSDDEPFERVIARLAVEERARVRLAARRDDDGAWTQTMLDVVAGEVTDGERAWEYPDALFFEFDASGKDVAFALRAGSISHGSWQVAATYTDPPFVYCHRRQSAAPSLYGPLPWPTADHDLGMPPPYGAGTPGPLIGPGAPSFASYNHAAAAFYDGDPVANPNYGMAAPCVRFPDRRARIDSVVVGPADLTISVSGSHLRGLYAELASHRPGPSQLIDDSPPATIKFALHDGLPPGAWVLVHDTHDWVDRRFLTWPYAITPEPGVTTQDPGPALEALVAGGEGPAVEFKREIPVLREARWRVARTISAFANADGGTILFGIDDDGTPAPLSAADAAPTALDSVANWVRDIVAPLPDFTVTMHAAPGGLGSIVALIIGPGVSPPYGVDPANPRYYIRRGATTFPASADQVRALARSRPDADQLSGLTFMR